MCVYIFLIHLLIQLHVWNNIKNKCNQFIGIFTFKKARKIFILFSAAVNNTSPSCLYFDLFILGWKLVDHNHRKQYIFLSDSDYIFTCLEFRKMCIQRRFTAPVSKWQIYFAPLSPIYFRPFRVYYDLLNWK